MTKKDYELRDLNEKFREDFNPEKTTEEDVISFVNKGGDLNYTRNEEYSNLIWIFINEDYMKELKLLQCLIDNGLDVNAKRKRAYYDSYWKEEFRTPLMHLLNMFCLNYYYTFSSKTYDKEDVNNLVKILLDNGAQLDIIEENGQKYARFDSENRYDIYKTQVKKGYVLPKGVKLYRNEKDDAFNEQMDDLSSAFDDVEDDAFWEDIEKSAAARKKQEEENPYTFEKWALEYLDGYEKGMEVYDGDIDCTEKEISIDYPEDFNDRPHIVYSERIVSLKGCPKIVNGNFNCSGNKLVSLDEAPVEVKGTFDCSNNWLETLECAPKKVEESFYCDNNSLISLKGSPDFVGGFFSCKNNKELKTLEHISKEIKNDIYCTDCENLEDIYSFVDRDKHFVYHSNTKVEQNNITFERWALRYLARYEKGMEVYEGHLDCSYSKYNHIKISSLEGCPKIVKGNFNCSKNNLTSLEGGPEVVEGIFDCSQNKLETLKGAPKKILVGFDSDDFREEIKVNDFKCTHNKLKSLEHIPKLDDELGVIDASWNQLKNIEHIQNKALKSLSLTDNKITSLKGCPEVIHKDFFCHKNELESLRFGPNNVGNYYSVDDNKLKSLKYMPKEVPYIFQCRDNLLENLDYHPLKVGAWSDCSNNRLKTLKGVENIEIRMYLNVYGNPEIDVDDYKLKEGTIEKYKRTF